MAEEEGSNGKKMMSLVQIHLHEATELGNVEMVDNLLDAGADPNVPDEKYGWTILHKATLHSHYILLKYLVEKVNVNVYAMDSESQIPFHLASKDIIIRYYVEDLRISINYVDQNNESLIMKLIKKNNFLMVQYIIEQYRDTINLNLQTEKNKDSALHISILKNNFQVFIVLLEHQQVPAADQPNDETETLIIEEEEEEGEENVSNNNRNNKINIYMKNKFGYNILHLSILKRRFDFVKEILRRFRNDDELLNSKDNFGNTPIFYAIETKRPDVIQWCVESGCDIQVLDRLNRSLSVKTAQLLRSELCSSLLWMDNPYVDILNYFLSLKVDPYPLGCRDTVITSQILHSSVKNMYFTEKFAKDQEIFTLTTKVDDLETQLGSRTEELGECARKLGEKEEEVSELKIKLLEEENIHLEQRRSLEVEKDAEIHRLNELLRKLRMESEEKLERVVEDLGRARRERAEEVEGMDRVAKRADHKTRDLESQLFQKREEIHLMEKRYVKRERKWKREIRKLNFEMKKQEKRLQETKSKFSQFFETL